MTARLKALNTGSVIFLNFCWFMKIVKSVYATYVKKFFTHWLPKKINVLANAGHSAAELTSFLSTFLYPFSLISHYAPSEPSDSLHVVPKLEHSHSIHLTIFPRRSVFRCRRLFSVSHDSYN